MASRVAPLLPLLLLLACTGPGQAPPAGVTLPAAAQPSGAGDPTRAAIISSAYVFGQPGSVAGDPARAAVALGQLEYLAADLPVNPLYIGLQGIVTPMLAQGREEARAVMGLRQDTPPQLAVDTFYATAVALRAGDRAAATAALGRIATDPAAVLARLAALPSMPRAAAATAAAYRGMQALDSNGRRGGRVLF